MGTIKKERFKAEPWGEDMRRWLAAIILIGSSSGHAWADTERCFLSVNHKVYIDRPCDVVRQPDGGFEIGTKETPVRYFAIVIMTRDRALGFWNGKSGVRLAEQSLGWLKSDGRCWFGISVKICATAAQ